MVVLEGVYIANHIDGMSGREDSNYISEIMTEGHKRGFPVWQ